VDADYLTSYPNSGLYVMQGRLSPPEDGRFQSFPRTRWQNEIELVPKVPLRGIEWIFDVYGEGSNPLETQEGRDDLRWMLQRSGIRVASICADYFMDRRFVGAPPTLMHERIAKLAWLISICPDLGIGRIVLPFVDASKIAGRADSERALYALHAVLAHAVACHVELHLETDMSPANFKSFLAEIDHPLVRVNYDSGNSGSLGYIPAEEFAAYGARIGSFHVKDRVLGGGTVPLGRGNVDFAGLRRALIDIDFHGDFVMQIARGVQGDELQWLRNNAVVVTRWLRGEAEIH
jgi:hexulose-6-phosphate isomerase